MEKELEGKKAQAAVDAQKRAKDYADLVFDGSCPSLS